MAYQSKFKSKEIDDLFKAFVALDSNEECYRFFEDLVTVKELQAMAQRWEVAKMLKSGKTYNEIVEATKASAATISRINKCLAYGADGYNNMIKKLEEK